MTAPEETSSSPAAGRTVPCGARFRAAVLELAAMRGVGVPLLLAASLLLAPEGGADPGLRDSDGEAVLEVGKTDASDAAIRKALAMALALSDPGARILPGEDVRRLEAAVETLGYRNKTLAHALQRLSFQPLDGRITDVRDAAQLFGFVNEWCFDEDQVRRRFRELAPVYHPDTGIVACRERMGQLIDARNLLVHHVRNVYGSGDWMGRRGGPSA
ncbi:hypothetical protein [Azospirillum lipoferum]|uniref:J domain-containing protein n=1 Tax=Azospirillum lipoferum (strain 4B) TaxID=862719 RepID=G7Z323_AZOL4|nr:hypothetical protein [Azospirillum lipoferum]CBS85758.1 protein of unknown function [Azospirillum lipoferum 4B]